ncbi:unnamed protein product [Rhodiola kirilowii]
MSGNPKPRRGPPKHQNKYAWDPDAFKKKNETEVGGKLRPYSDVTGVCPRCRDQIQWKRKYGKYKPLVEPAKCQRCSKRNVRQAYHNLCTGCAKEHHVCAKCSCQVDYVVGRDLLEVEAEKKALEDALKNSRERDRRTILRMMNKGKSQCQLESQLDTKSKAGDLFSATSISQYVNGKEKVEEHGKDEDQDTDEDSEEYEDLDTNESGENEEKVCHLEQSREQLALIDI